MVARQAHLRHTNGFVSSIDQLIAQEMADGMSARLSIAGRHHVDDRNAGAILLGGTSPDG